MNLQSRINFYGKSLKETTDLNIQTFDSQNPDIPHLMTLDCPAVYQVHDKREIDVCKNEFCSNVLCSLGLNNGALVKLNCILGYQTRFCNINECVICVRKRTASYIKTYNLNPKKANDTHDRSLLVFDYVNKVGGYNKNHAVCFKEEKFFMGSKKNEYVVSFNGKNLCNPIDSVYEQNLN